MSIPTFAALRVACDSPRQPLEHLKTVTSVAGEPNMPYSAWLQGPIAGVAPTTAVVPTNATAGAVPLVDSAGVQRLVQVTLNAVCASSQVGGTLILIDRLSHQGGLSGIVTGAQTTNLPTAALTRYTSGVGVYAALEIYATVGVTPAPTVSVSYTNSAGTAGQIAPDTLFGNTPQRVIGRFLPLPLAAGDVGVRSVESVTLAGSTGTAGNFGVTLYKPLLCLPVLNYSVSRTFDGLLDCFGMLPQLVAGTCLSFLWWPANVATASPLGMRLAIAEE